MKYDINSFTLEEKLSLLTGKNSWQTPDANGKLPTMWLADGPHGVRKSIDENALPSTVMPCLVNIANSWNKELAYLDGQTIADDCIEKEVDLLLAPGVNIKRTPLCGRNFEYFSEDPFLAGTLAKAYIEGVQDKGIGTSLKHFALNNREYERLWQSSEADERTMREIYFTAFEIALKAKPWTVMSSYNAVNGVYAVENKWLIKDVLRGDLGFDGLVVSDWGSCKVPYRTTKASVDLIMSHNSDTVDNVKKALKDGLITMEEVDACVNRLLELLEKNQANAHKRIITTTPEQRHQNAVEIAKESFVLLKNDGVLPIKGGKIKLIENSDILIGGTGSAKVTAEYQTQTLSNELQKQLTDATIFVSPPYFNETISHTLKHELVLARQADTVILTVNGRAEGENYDREEITLSKVQEERILNVAKVNPNVVVVVYAGSAIDMRNWIDKVKAVVFAGLGGQGVNQALAEVLCGKTSPSGKLSETFPLSIEDTPTGRAIGNSMVERYTEGVFVGYRYYDTNNKPVLFPFGHGLSYAKFEYSNLKIEKKGEAEFTVSYDITNLSNIDAKEVSQVYVSDVFANVSRPEKELKGFSKDLIKAGQTVNVKVDLDFRSFAYYNQPLKRWQVDNGEFEILVGASSRDIRLKESIFIDLPEKTQLSK